MNYLINIKKAWSQNWLLLACLVFYAFTINDVNKNLAIGIQFLPLTSTVEIGTLEGELTVNSNGGANYEVPIMVPPGTNGVQPDLAVVYNSQSGIGEFGSGWSLRGLSSIQRIGQSMLYDGQITAIRYTHQDRFTLNGQRLIAYRDADGDLLTNLDLRAAAYGKDGTEYRTEIDQGSRVVSYGDCGNGPCYFKLFNKDGSVAFYGFTEDARFANGMYEVRHFDYSNTNWVEESDIQQTWAWAINKVMDVHTNYTEVNYSEDQTPLSILYTGNENRNVLPQRIIRFYYNYRSGNSSIFSGGVETRSNKLINNIRTYVLKPNGNNGQHSDEELVHWYQFEYDEENNPIPSLKEIKLCDALGSCLPATTIEYNNQERQIGTFEEQEISLGGTLYKEKITGEFNGDGKMDIISYNPRSKEEANILLAIDQDSFNLISGIFQDGSFDFRAGSVLYPGDFNGDGITDFIRMGKNPLPSKNQIRRDIEQANRQNIYTKQQPFEVYSSNGDGSFTLENQDSMEFELLEYLVDLAVGDFNGDGISDFIVRSWIKYDENLRRNDGGNFANNQLYISTGNGRFEQSTEALNRFSGKPFMTGDFDGDGKTDILGTDNSTYRLHLQDESRDFRLSEPTFLPQNNSLNPFDQESNTQNNGEIRMDIKSSFENEIIGSVFVSVLQSNRGQNRLRLNMRARARSGFWEWEDFEINIPFRPQNVIPVYGKNDEDLDLLIVSENQQLLILFDWGNSFLDRVNGDWFPGFPGSWNNQDNPVERQNWRNGNISGTYTIRNRTVRDIFPPKIYYEKVESSNFDQQQIEYLRAKSTISNISLGDFNGDGLTDYLHKVSSQWDEQSNSITLRLSTGNGLFKLIYLDEFRRNIPQAILTFDHNNDGKSDLLGIYQWGEAVIHLSDGDGFPVSQRINTNLGLTDNQFTIIPGDFDGDGATDFMKLINNQDANWMQIFYSKTKKANLVSKITNGLGKVSEVLYKPITDDSIYTKKQEEIVEEINIQFPLYVVQKHTIKDQAENAKDSLVYDYRYKKALISRERGWMGFEETQIIDNQHEVINLTIYNNTFPKLGSIKERKSLDLKNPTTILSQTITEHESYQIPDTRIYRVLESKHTVLNFTEGRHNFTLQKSYLHDEEKVNVTAIINEGDVDIDDDEIITRFKFSTHDYEGPDWWRNFFPLQKKVSKIDTVNFETWNQETDLSWKLFDYDDQMNLIEEASFRDTDGGIGDSEIRNTMISKKSDFDDFGNLTRLYAPGDQSDYIEFSYENEYHTFIRSTLVPKYQLRTFSTYDPRFGQVIEETDFNGNYALKIPSLGMDGLGNIIRIQGPDPFENQRLIDLSETQLSKVGPYTVSTFFHRNNWNSSRRNIEENWYWNSRYMDSMGKEIKSESKGYMRQTKLVEEWEYNDRGVVEKTFLPHFLNERTGKIKYSEQGEEISPQEKVYSKNEYDRHGRPLNTYYPTASDNQALQLEQEIIYDRLNDRIIIHRRPDPREDGQYLRWIQVSDTHGRILSRSGPYTDDIEMNVLPETDTTRYRYDRLGTLIEVIDPLKQSTLYHYNSLGEQIEEVKKETGTTRYQYNDRGGLLEKIDANGQRLKLTYDGLNRMIKKEAFDKEGNLSSTTSFIFDSPSVSNGKGKLCKIISNNSYTEFHYDNTGAIKEERKSINDLDLNNDSQPETFITRFFYTPSGHLEKKILPDGTSVVYQINNYNGKLTGVGYANNRRQNYKNYINYFSNGNAKYQSFTNGVASDNNHDAVGRILSSQTSKGRYQHRNVSYQYNQAEKITKIKDERIDPEKNRTESFAYDARGRLLQAIGGYGTQNFTYDAAGNRLTDNQFRYEYKGQAKHQLEKIRNKNDNSLAFSMQYDANGNLIQKNAVNPITSEESSEGNTFQSSEVKFNYDEENRLTSVLLDNEMVNEFTYGSSRNRISKKESDGTITFYLTPDYEVIQKPNGQFLHTRYITGESAETIMTYTRNNSKVRLLRAEDPFQRGEIVPTIIDNPTNYYRFTLVFFTSLFILFCLIYGLHLGILKSKRSTNRNYLFNKNINGFRPIGVGFLILIICLLPSFPLHAQQTTTKGQPTDGQVRYFHQNHLGSPVLLTDGTGGLTNDISYKPFGAVDESNTTGEDNYRPKFTGKEYDEKIGLYYFGSRFYDAHSGRFITPDPDDQYYSPYLYGNDDPLNGIDPDGNDFGISIAIVVIAAAVGAYIGASLANDSFNPGDWNFRSKETWVGIIVGGAIGVAVGSFGVAALLGGNVGSVNALALGWISLDVAFIANDAYLFSEDQSAENGIYLAINFIPVAGFLISKAARGLKAARRATTVASRGSRLSRGARGASRASRASRANRGRRIARRGKIVDKAPCMSFAADTEVWTPDDIKPIQDIQVGDNVFGYNEQRNSIDTFAVSRIFKRIVPAILLVALTNDTIAVTPEHPFYQVDKGWMEAHTLESGDELLQMDGKETIIQFVEQKLEDTEVYNFEVEGVHNYYVSKNRVLVHNPTCAQDAVTLRNNMRNAGEIEPPFPNQAHHIVESHDPYMQVARDHLNNLGVDINHPNNGIFLPHGSDTYRNWSRHVPGFEHTPPHSKIHTIPYKNMVSHFVLEANTANEALEILYHIKILIQDGYFNKFLRNFP